MEDHSRLFDKAGVNEYDLYRLSATVNEIQLRGFDIEAVREPVNASGYAVRALSREGDLIGIGLSSCSDESGLDKCIHDAKFFSGLNKQKMKYEFPEMQRDSRAATIDPAIKNTPSESIKKYTKSLLNALKDENKGNKPIKPTFGKIRTYLFETQLENSAGLAKRKAETYFYLELALKVSDGVKFAEFWPRKYRRRIDDLKVKDVLPYWIKLARETLDAVMPPAAKMTVILNPESLCDAIVPTVGSHATGDQKFKNQSIFKKGDVVASEEFSVSDDGLLDYGLSTAPFDDEGNPQRKTPIIEKGVFKNFIYDQKYGMMLSEKSTGNGLKPVGGMRNPLSKHMLSVVAAPTNISISPGNKSFDNLIEEIKDGLLVEQFSWLNPDPFSSGFSSEIRNAYLIRNGELGKPIKGGMVAGKVFEMIKNISGISNLPQIESGATAFSCYSPYIRFENLQVTGK